MNFDGYFYILILYHFIISFREKFHYEYIYTIIILDLVLVSILYCSTLEVHSICDLTNVRMCEDKSEISIHSVESEEPTW